MDTLRTIANRKSVRSYAGTPVEPEKVTALVEAAGQAPCAGMLAITVVENPAALKALDEAALQAMRDSDNEFLRSRAGLPGYRPLYGAPLLLLFSAPRGGSFDAYNGSAAAATATIAATALGLGSCFVLSPIFGFKARPELTATVGVPDGFTPICGALIGYSAGEAFATAERQSVSVNYCK